MWFDENGMPTPYPPKQRDPLLEMYSQQTAPPEPPPAAPAPAYTNKQMDLEDQFGIRTRGPKADQAAQTAMGYNAPSVDGQAMPQQFGTAEYDRQERPLTPQETAEAMPLEGLRPKSRDSVKDILYKATGIKPGPQGSSDGVENARTAQMEAKRAREEQAQINRASAREKSGDAWQKTLALNALQGAGPWAMGGGGGGMGSPGMGSPISGGGGNMSRVGGYLFVGGRWRPQDASEAAKTRGMNSDAAYTEMRPGLDRERIAADNSQASSRNRIAESGLELERGRLNESTRHNQATEEQRKALLEAERTADLLKQYDKDADELDDMFVAIKERSGNAARFAPSGGPDWEKALDTDYKTFDPDPKDTTGKTKIPRYTQGSHKALSQKAVSIAKRLVEASKSGKFNREIDPEALQFLMSLEGKDLDQGLQQMAAEYETPAKYRKK